MAANRKGIGPTMLKHACNSTTNTHTKYLSVDMHKTLCSVWLTFVRRENETFQNCPIVLKNSSSSSSLLNRCNSQTTQATELSQTRTRLYYHLRLSRKAHDTSFQGQRQFLTALAIKTVLVILNSAHYK